MKFPKLSLSVLVFFIIALIQLSHAQNWGKVNSFMNTHPAVSITDPSNTMTTATKVLTYTDQPTAGDTFTIRDTGRGITEIYEFYALGGSYSGSNTGISLSSSMDVTYTTVTAYLNLHSRIVHCTNSTGANTITPRAINIGTGGNYIRIDTTDLHNITSTNSLFTGGASSTAGLAGAMIYNRVNGRFWLKTADNDTTATPIWKYVTLNSH